MLCPQNDLHRLFRRCLYATYRSAGTQGADYALQRNGRTLYLLFEASRGLSDWKNNLDFPARAYRENERRFFVHRGFLGVWQSIKEDVAAYWKKCNILCG